MLCLSFVLDHDIKLIYSATSASLGNTMEMIKTYLLMLLQNLKI